MALISCPECGREISDAAKKCPNCGYALKKVDMKKVLMVVGAAFLLAAAIAAAYYFLIYTPQQLPVQAAELLAKGDYVGADKLYARLGKDEENLKLREQLYYESRAVNAAKAAQDNLIFPDSMVLTEVLAYKHEYKDEQASSETQDVYVNDEPQFVLHYLAKSKGGSMVDGYVVVDWDAEAKAYDARSSVSDLTIADELPWYIADDDYEAQIDFWSEEVQKGDLLDVVRWGVQIGSVDIDRCNAVLAATLGKDVAIIPAGDLVVTPTPRIVQLTPAPTEEAK